MPTSNTIRIKTRSPQEQAQHHIDHARKRIGEVAWRTIGPDLRQALACEAMVRSMSGKDETDTHASQAARMILVAQAIMAADFDA